MAHSVSLGEKPETNSRLIKFTHYTMHISGLGTQTNDAVKHSKSAQMGRRKRLYAHEENAIICLHFILTGGLFCKREGDLRKPVPQQLR